MSAYLISLALSSAGTGLAALLLAIVTPFLKKRFSARSLAALWLIATLGFLIPWRPAIAPLVRVSSPLAENGKLKMENGKLGVSTEVEEITAAPSATTGIMEPPADDAMPNTVPTAASTSVAVPPTDSTSVAIPPADATSVAVPPADSTPVAVPPLPPALRATPLGEGGFSGGFSGGDSAGDSAGVFSRLSMVSCVLALWSLGFFVLIFRQIYYYVRFLRTVRRWSEPVTDEATLNIFDDLKRRMTIRRSIRLLRSESAASPLMFGLTRPTILLPKIAIPDEELAFVLRHELTHYVRSDLWVRTASFLAVAFHWFNPCAWLTGRMVGQFSELACDEQVTETENADGRRVYVEAILGVIKARHRAATVLTTQFLGGEKGMKQRIFSIMEPAPNRSGRILLAATILFIVGAGMIFGVAQESPKGEMENGKGKMENGGDADAASVELPPLSPSAMPDMMQPDTARQIVAPTEKPTSLTSTQTIDTVEAHENLDKLEQQLATVIQRQKDEGIEPGSEASLCRLMYDLRWFGIRLDSFGPLFEQCQRQYEDQQAWGTVLDIDEFREFVLATPFVHQHFIEALRKVIDSTSPNSLPNAIPPLSPTTDAATPLQEGEISSPPATPTLTPFYFRLNASSEEVQKRLDALDWENSTRIISTLKAPDKTLEVVVMADAKLRQKIEDALRDLRIEAPAMISSEMVKILAKNYARGVPPSELDLRQLHPKLFIPGVQTDYTTSIPLDTLPDGSIPVWEGTLGRDIFVESAQPYPQYNLAGEKIADQTPERFFGARVTADFVINALDGTLLAWREKSWPVGRDKAAGDRFSPQAPNSLTQVEANERLNATWKRINRGDYFDLRCEYQGEYGFNADWYYTVFTKDGDLLRGWGLDMPPKQMVYTGSDHFNVPDGATEFIGQTKAIGMGKAAIPEGENALMADCRLNCRNSRAGYALIFWWPKPVSVSRRVEGKEVKTTIQSTVLFLDAFTGEVVSTSEDHGG